jgi:hypothetical protein
MNARIERLRTHQANIDRYESMLGTDLTTTERQFVEQRLSEERLGMALVQCMGPAQGGPTGHDLSQGRE